MNKKDISRINEIYQFTLETELKRIYNIIVKETSNSEFNNRLLINSAIHGNEALCRICKDLGATNFDKMLICATRNGDETLCKLAKEWGATNFDSMRETAKFYSYDHLHNLAIEWSAK